MAATLKYTCVSKFALSFVRSPTIKSAHSELRVFHVPDLRTPRRVRTVPTI